MSALKLLSAAALLAAASAAYCPKAVHFALGSYTGQPWLPTAAGAGVTLAVLRPPHLNTTARLSAALVGDNPSYLAATGGHIYAANENAPNGSLAQLTFGPRAPYVAGARRTSGGAGSTHVAVLRRAARGVTRIVVLANFGGSITTFVRRPSGLVVGDTYTVPVENARLAGQPDAFPQEAPHPHMVLPYKDGVLVPDLGSDAVWRFRVYRRTGRLRLVDSVRLRAGDGPRHAALHGSGAVLVVNELSLTLVVLRPGKCGKGLKSVCQRVSLVRDGARFEGATAAAVRVSADGRFAYASVRAPKDERRGVVVAFRLDPRTGRVKRRVGQFGSGGVHPRDLFIVERVRVGRRCRSFIAVVNRDSNNLVLFERNARTGAVARKPSFSMEVKTPTSVLQIA